MIDNIKLLKEYIQLALEDHVAPGWSTGVGNEAIVMTADSDEQDDVNDYLNVDDEDDQTGIA